MKIAVTGGTGFIGRYIIRNLAAAGHSLRCWYRPTGDRSGMDDVAESVTWVEGDLGDRASAAELVRGADAVVHSALYHPGGGFRGGEGDILEFVERNVVGTLVLIEASRAAGVGRFVFLSTCAVYEKILDNRPLDEAHPTWPSSHYGAHKAALEKFVHSYGFGLGYPICALRPTGVYGPAHPIEKSKWFDLIRAVVRGERVTCCRGGKEVHAADVAKAVGILLAADEVKITGQAFNCYDLYVSDYEIAALAKRLSESNANIEGEPTRPKHQIDTTKIRGLGMEFGGKRLFERSISELVKKAM